MSDPKFLKNPLARRPSFRAQDLIAVQPMSLPSGLIFYVDYVYGSPKKCPECETEFTGLHPENDCKYGSIQRVIDE